MTTLATNTNNPIRYTVRYTHTSAVERFDSLDDACDAVHAVFPGAVIDHESLPECAALVWRDDVAGPGRSDVLGCAMALVSVGGKGGGL